MPILVGKAIFSRVPSNTKFGQYFSDENIAQIIQPNKSIFVDSDLELFKIVLAYVRAMGNINVMTGEGLKDSLILRELEFWEVKDAFK